MATLSSQAKVFSTPIRTATPGRTAREWRNGSAFAALKRDGSVVTWGDPRDGGDSSRVASQLRSGVTQIFSTVAAFAALKSDGSVITWGDFYNGGDSFGVASQLRSGVTQIFSTSSAFAALKSDGSVITWGGGEDGDSSRVASQLRSGVTQIFSSKYAFAALKRDGSVITWGSFYNGGDSFGVASQLRSGVTQIFSTDEAFAALKSDGSVITWGDFYLGGDSSGVANQLRSGVTQIFSTDEAFAALKSDGSVITWGDFYNGGDSSGVANQLRSGVTQIFSASNGFAALKSDGSVITWGEYYDNEDRPLVTGVQQIFSNWHAFAALKSDGSVVTWGNSSWGGDSSGVASQLSSGVTQIFSNGYAFAALKSDGSVITWGNSYDGGDSSSVASQLRSGVVSFANPFTDDRLVVEAGPPPVLSLSATRASQSEGKSGSTPFLFTVTRAGNTSGVSTVTWSIDAGGTGATFANATDFKGGAFPSGTLTFSAGATSQTVTVNVVGDTTAETNESFRLTLSAATGASLHPTAFRSTGTILNDDLIGTATNNTLIGSGLAEFIDGRQGRDALTGAAARDVFGFSYGHSTIPAPDRITDFQIGVDKIDLITAAGSALPAPTALSRAANNTTARTLSDLATAVFRDANGAAAGNQALGANRAALVVATRTPIAGTYLFINDGNAARNNSNDLLINITGYAGDLPGLGGITVGTVFA